MKQFGESKKLVKGLSIDEFFNLMKIVPSKDKVAKTAFILAYGSGLRISEVINLKKQDIQNNKINIWDSKGGRDRVVPKPKLLKEYMLNEIPLKITDRTLQRKFKAYAKKAGLPEHYVFHSLRHGFALAALERGTPINDLQVFMGHSNLSVTNVYTKARPEDALNRFDGVV